jgi:pimeloyl-ACP methyl ester carboxylesterase
MSAARSTSPTWSLAVANQLGLCRPVLVGQSLGGHTAMLTAAAYPDLVRAVVLVEAVPVDLTPRGQATMRRWLESVAYAVHLP